MHSICIQRMTMAKTFGFLCPILIDIHRAYDA
jgi:hypothetical protein